jgi:phosphatidylserine/phosphatidylglycerophosphate/cardiolipin synthase-like enzyme
MKYQSFKNIFLEIAKKIYFASLFFISALTANDSKIDVFDQIPKVIIHPDVNNDFEIKLLKEAKKFIAFSALSIPTQKFAEEVVNAQKRGVKIYLTITNPFFEVGTDYSSLSKKFETDIQTLKNMKERLLRDIDFLNILTDNNIYPHYLNRKYYINHQKLLIVDDLALIASSPRCEKRDFCITVSNKKEVEALGKFFFHDYDQIDDDEEQLEKMSYVIGPKNQRKKLENLFLSAKKSIHLYASDFNDKSICSIVENLLQNSVEVYLIITSHFFGFNEQSLNTDYYLKRIKQFGAKVKVVREPFIHSKIIMVDMNDNESKKMYFGSCNIFTNSIDHTRELGLITQNDDYIQPIFNTFLKDWERGADF